MIQETKIELQEDNNKRAVETSDADKNFLIVIYKTSFFQRGMEQTLTFHVSQLDKDRISKAAAERRMSLSTFVRTLIFEKLEKNLSGGENAE